MTDYTIYFILSTLAVTIKGAEILTLQSPLSYDDTKILSEIVCDYQFPEPSMYKEMNVCTKRFTSSHRNITARPPKLTVKCQLEKRVKFAIDSSESSKLVVLVPKDDAMDDINYEFSFLEGNEEIGDIDTGSWNYTVWTTVLNNDGSPSLWLKGPEVEKWKSPEPMKYDITRKVLTHTFNNDTREIDMEFAWNVTDETDSCFSVLNYCNKKTMGDYFQRTLPLETRSVVIEDLKLDDNCTFYVIGKYGKTRLIYQTPECYDIDGCVPLPEKFQNVSIKVSEALSGLGWRVQLSWKRPRVNPTLYNVTLLADFVYNVIMPGSATDVVFDEVSGEGLGNVTLVAVTASGKAYAIYELLLPPLETQSGHEGLLIAAAWLAALLIPIVASIFVYCKRRQTNKIKIDYLQGLQEKLCKEGVLEAGRPAAVVPTAAAADDRWEVHWSRLELHEQVGEGAFGVVRRATLAPARQVAVKMLKDFPTADEVRSFRAEMELMKNVGAHPHVVSLVGCCSGRRPLIIAEYCSLGDLLTFLRCSWDMMLKKRNEKYCKNDKENSVYQSGFYKGNSRKQDNFAVNKLYDLQGACDELTFSDLLSYCRQIAMGMEFLASNRVVHRDLAARNVLVTGDKTLKIADFGLSRDIYQENQYMQKSNGKMPVKWMALESLTHRIFTTQSDVWSFGVVMWEVVTVGGAPYPAVAAARLPRLLRSGYRMPRPANCTPQLYELMSLCWRARPNERPTFAQLHARLDELLAAVCTDHYLPLELDVPADVPLDPHTPPAAPIGEKHAWEREHYDRPTGLSNHYTTTPVTQPTGTNTVPTLARTETSN